MEAFGLLKYWRGGGGAAAASGAAGARPAVSITTIAASALRSADDTDDDSADGDDDGPFFDLEFALPEEGCDCDGHEEEDGDARSSHEEEGREEGEFNFTLSSEGSCGDLQADRALQLSPSDDLFFKGRLLPLVCNQSESPAKTHVLPVSLLKTKFRVLLLGLRRAKQASVAAPTGDVLNGAAGAAAAPSPKHPQQRQSKLFTVKFKVEEVPIVSLFTRDNSSRSTGGGSSSGRAAKQMADECGVSPAAGGEKKMSKELVQKYLNKIKPLYVRVSKRHAEKPRFSGQLSGGPLVSKEPRAQASPVPTSAAMSGERDAKATESESAVPAAAPVVPAGAAKPVQTKPSQGGNLPAGLRVVCKHLGKSRSASAAVAAVPSPTPTIARRRDDSLLQQQDGIQSAIAHCKMSFNASKEGDLSLIPSKIESFHDKTADPSRTCFDRAREGCV